ncbi:hypothetical protein C8J56DRAFT_1043617 [Mycena floridula]|nr:hypothetical protein C8J56DRAFT_1043617 [Mycena floridula]
MVLATIEVVDFVLFFAFERLYRPGSQTFQLYVTLSGSDPRIPVARFLWLDVRLFADDLIVIRDPDNLFERWIRDYRRAHQERLSDLERERARTNLRPSPINSGPTYIQNLVSPERNLVSNDSQTRDEIQNTSPLPIITSSETSPTPRLSHSPTPSQQASPNSTNLSRNPSSSSGDSSDEETRPRARIMSRNNSHLAEVTQANASKCCEVSDGEISPQLMHEFSRKQRNWFVAKEIKKEDQAKRSFVAFSNHRKLDKYIDNNQDRLAALTFEAFMTDLKAYALEEDWAKKVLTELMSKKLKSGSFATHSQDMVYLNRLLEGTNEHQSDIQMRSHVTASIPPELHSHAFGITAASYDDWSSDLVKLIKKDYELSQHLALANPNVTATIQNAATHNNFLQGPFQYQQPSNDYQNQYRPNQDSFPNQNTYSASNNMPPPNQNRNQYQQRYNQNQQSNSFQGRQQDNGYGNRPIGAVQGSGVRGPLQQVDKTAPNYDWPPYLKDPDGSWRLSRVPSYRCTTRAPS